MEVVDRSVRVRFAPSPTGNLHIGGVRTALFNYLFAKRYEGGRFILRLEDTDRERYVPTSVDQIWQSLQWLGLIPDEGFWLGENRGSYGPYKQSERLDIYQKYAQKLIEQGNAYYSRISPEDFASKKKTASAEQKAFVYRQNMEPSSAPAHSAGYPVRLKITPGMTKWHDKLRGDFTIDNATIDDFVIIKADGYPTYNFANVIDDHLMAISHVIRGDEFIASTAKHVILYDYLQFNQPQFAHLPAILGPDGKKKLSKRDGDVDVLSYRENGYLADALVNFLALLGWNDGTEQEIYSREQLVKKFLLVQVGREQKQPNAGRADEPAWKQIQKSPAVFDIERLRWMNGHYIRQLSGEELAAAVKPFVPAAWLEDENYFHRALALEHERLKTLAEARDLLEFFFVAPQPDRAQLVKHATADTVAGWLQAAADTLGTSDFAHDPLETALRQLAADLQIETKQLFYVLRVAVTGRTAAPGLFDVLSVLGREPVLARLHRALAVLDSHLN